MNYPFPCKFERGAYSQHYLLSCVTEAAVQRDILQLLAAYKVDGVAIDAGGRRHRGRMIKAIEETFGAGMKLPRVKTGGEIPSGFSDIEATLAPSGRSVYIEVKAPVWLDQRWHIIRAAGKPSIDQLEFLQSKFDRGALVLVAWSALDVERTMMAELKANRAALS